MGLFGISEEKETQLLQRMEALGIVPEDLEESFIRSGGPGGQNVNKVSTCVQLKHLSSGIIIKCQRERSQAMNRMLARRILCEKLEALTQGREGAERRRVEKIRRQKRKRSKRAKAKMLADKRHVSSVKATRRSPSSEEH
jgi:protein subunit release factor B